MTFRYKKYLEIKEKAKKTSENIEIIAISKFHPIESVILALDCGVRVFGENRVQEAGEKFLQLRAKYPDIELHCTGNLQTNKIKQALKIFDVFHTIYKEKQLIEFAKYPQDTSKKRFFLQVNTGYEENKIGAHPKDIKKLLHLCKNKYHLNISGLMCIPPINDSPSKHFNLLKELKEKYNLGSLSMGMSNDYEEAISCGSNYLRIGTLLFGDRK